MEFKDLLAWPTRLNDPDVHRAGSLVVSDRRGREPAEMATGSMAAFDVSEAHNASYDENICG